MAMNPNEFRKNLKGVVHLVLTPFTAGDELDEQALRDGVRNAVNHTRGEDVVFLALGSTGEFYAMTEAENRRVTDIVIEEVNGEHPVVIGAARAGTKNTIAATREAKEAGADAVLIVHPFYVPPVEEELIRHYQTISDSVDIGICVYNNPATSKLWAPPQLMKKLSKIPNVVGLKENTPNMMDFISMMQTLDPDDISIFAGLGHCVYQFVCYYGCGGYVTELINFAPHLALDLLHAGRVHDIEKVRKTVDTIELLWEFIARVAARRTRIPSALSPAPSAAMPYYQAVNKAAMDLTGTRCGKVRAPMCNLTDAELIELRDVLKQMGCAVI